MDPRTTMTSRLSRNATRIISEALGEKIADLRGRIIEEQQRENIRLKRTMCSQHYCPVWLARAAAAGPKLWRHTSSPGHVINDVRGLRLPPVELSFVFLFFFILFFLQYDWLVIINIYVCIGDVSRIYLWLLQRLQLSLADRLFPCTVDHSALAPLRLGSSGPRELW